jgi:PAS domain S-box-containing protein
MSEQQRIAKGLDHRVAERMRELAEANDALKKELAAERQRTDAARRASDCDARLILASIPGLVSILTAAGAVDFVNEPLVEYCGRTLEELKQWGTSDTVHPEDLPRVARMFTQAIASGEPYDFEARLRRFDGAYRWFQVRGLPLRDAGGAILRWYALHTDIDERKRTEDALRHSEASLRAIVETTPECVHVIAGDGTLLSVNAAGAAMAGAPSVDLMLGRNFYDLVTPEDRERYRAFNESVCAGQKGFLEFHIFRMDGECRDLETRAAPLRNDDGTVAQLGVARDITARKQAEARLRESQRNLRDTQEKLAYMMRVTTMAEMTASIAHEVNQPLSGILTNAGTSLRMLAADPPDVDGACETARRTIRDANRASDVIVRLRALFTGKELATESMDLNEATREVIALSMSELQRHRVMLRPELADDLPLVTANRVQLQQVILNLLRNASDAMAGVDDGPRHLLIRTECDEDDRVRLTVQDVGVGLDSHVMDKVFQAFYTTKSGGMGIGLSVSRSIIEKHGGHLWGEPNDGPGATFAFSIPRVPERTTDAAHVMGNP